MAELLPLCFVFSLSLCLSVCFFLSYFQPSSIIFISVCFSICLLLLTASPFAAQYLSLSLNSSVHSWTQAEVCRIITVREKHYGMSSCNYHRLVHETLRHKSILSRCIWDKRSTWTVLSSLSLEKTSWSVYFSLIWFYLTNPTGSRSAVTIPTMVHLDVTFVISRTVTKSITSSFASIDIFTTFLPDWICRMCFCFWDVPVSSRKTWENYLSYSSISPLQRQKAVQSNSKYKLNTFTSIYNSRDNL